jgi:hypothetical protein
VPVNSLSILSDLISVILKFTRPNLIISRTRSGEVYISQLNFESKEFFEGFFLMINHIDFWSSTLFSSSSSASLVYCV